MAPRITPSTHLGLFTDKNEGSYAMTEAVAAFQTPHQLRFLFSCIILEGYPTIPLWNAFQNDLALNYIPHNSSLEHAFDNTLTDIHHYLKDCGHQLHDYGLPEPQQRSPEVAIEIEYLESRHDHLQQQTLQKEQMMNNEQRQIYNYITTAVQAYHGDRQHYMKPTFVEGKPG